MTADLAGIQIITDCRIPEGKFVVDAAVVVTGPHTCQREDPCDRALADRVARAIHQVRHPWAPCFGPDDPGRPAFAPMCLAGVDGFGFLDEARRLLKAFEGDDLAVTVKVDQ